MSKRLCYIVLLIMALAACGGGDELPPEKPATQSSASGAGAETLLATVSEGVSGLAVDGPVANGLISIYSYIGGEKGEMLGSTTTDSTGAYALTFRAATQPLLIELSSGSYVEDASGVAVNIDDGQVLRSLVLYNEGDAISSMVTPLTHMIAALAEFKIANGDTVNDAISQAHATFFDAFNFDATTTVSHNINDASAASSVVSNSHRYGFILAGISSWTQWVSEQNNAAMHTTYNSMRLSQVIYNDLLADGVLDGRGINKAGSGAMDLAIGGVPVTADLYRFDLPQHMQIMAASGRNKTTLTTNHLRSAALAMTTNSSPIIGAGNRNSTITLVKSESSALACGIHTVALDFGSAVIVESARFSIDGNFEAEVRPYSSLVEIAIDTRQYAAGTHLLSVSATDVLGQTHEQQFSIILEAALPFVLPPANRMTNNSLLRGIYCDSGITSINVNGQSASLTTGSNGGTWEANVSSLVEGVNNITIVAADSANNRYSTNMTIVLDTNYPVIDTVARHGIAKFSQGNGTFVLQVLDDTNEGLPLYIETTSLALQGVPIIPPDLNLNEIPYFGFEVSDMLGVAGSTADDIEVRMQYKVNGIAVAPWRDLAANVSDDTYLVPLVTDYLLPSDWAQSVPTDLHEIGIQIEDAAGNETETEFTFRAEFYVPEMTVNHIVEVGASTFNNTEFSERSDLYGAEVDVVSYNFTNSTDHAFYIEFSDPSSHTVVQEFDEMERVHLVDSTTTSTEWRAGYIDVRGPCSAQPTWQPVSSILNWNGFTWIPESPPAPQVSNDSGSIETDSLTTTTDWQDAADFDNIHLSSVGGTYTYTYDYILGATNPAWYSAAFITNWQQPGGVQCNDVRNFQERTVNSYVSAAGYPRNEFRSYTQPPQSFSTTDIRLINDSTGSEMLPYLGSGGLWYRVAAGSSVTAIKRVTMPSLTLYNDLTVDINNTSFNSYDPRRLDQRISWTIEGLLEASVVHDAGEANLLAMPVSSGSVNTNTVNYAINR